MTLFDLSMDASLGSEEDEEEVNHLQQRAVLFLSGDIDKSHLEVCGVLLNYHFNKDFNEPIQLIINSDGGDCSVGWSIVDMMNFIRLPVYTTAVGIVASMAADIFANGDHRTIGEHSTIMIHPHSSMRYGSHSQLVAHAKSDEIEHNRRLTHYLNNSKYATLQEVEQKLFTTRGDDLWLTPEELFEHGLCDQIAKSDKAKRRKHFGFSPASNGTTTRIPRRSKTKPPVKKR